MALVRVVGLSGNIKVVPSSIFESSLKNMGYRLFEPQKLKKEESEEFVESMESGMPENNEEESSEAEDVESIPLGEMNGSQVKKYAELHGIDVTSAKSTREAKEIVREWLRENGE